KIADKRDEIIKAFNARREQIVEQLNKRSSSLEQIGLRVLKNIENKSQTLSSREEILSFYASDLMINKIRELISELKALSDVSKAENLENLLKKSQEDALRVLRDKTELYVDGENIISLGKHKFAVNRQQLSLTLLRRNEELYFHLTGTSFYQKVKNQEIQLFQDIWEQELVSENKSVYRAEYLAYKTFLDSQGEENFDAESFITQTVEQNYSENYVKGVHNADALLIYQSIKGMDDKLELLRYSPFMRATAHIFWFTLMPEVRQKLKALIQATQSVLQTFPNTKRVQSTLEEIEKYFRSWNTAIQVSQLDTKQVAKYLFESQSQFGKMVLSESADHLKQEFVRALENKKSLKAFQEDLENEFFNLEDKYYLILNWLHAFVDEHHKYEPLRQHIEEAAVELLFLKEEYQLHFAHSSALLEGLKGN